MFVVSEAQVRYLQSARLDDELLVTTTRLALGRASLTLLQQAHRVQTTQPVLLCQAQIRAGWIDQHGKAARIPPDILQRIT